MSDDELEKVMTPRGSDARSMTSVTPNDLGISYGNQSAPGEGADWFGPQQPMRPIAPPEVAGRQWDYWPGYNLATQPRPFEQVDFRTLRSLADAYDPVRLILERRKDQMCRVPWTIRVKHEEGAKKTSQPSPQMRGIIKDVGQFFKFPSEGVSFRSWLRAILEDLLVLDQPAIYAARDQGGHLVSLDYIDGATIKPVIDDRGRLPRAQPWDGSPFNWLGQTITIENYASIGCKITGGLLYLPSFQQILKGLPAVNYTTPWDLIVKPLNLRTNSVFGRSPVEQIMMTISIAMRRSFSQLQYFTEGNTPAALYGVP
jgi:hypothetical protein